MVSMGRVNDPQKKTKIHWTKKNSSHFFFEANIPIEILKVPMTLLWKRNFNLFEIIKYNFPWLINGHAPKERRESINTIGFQGIWPLFFSFYLSKGLLIRKLTEKKKKNNRTPVVHASHPRIPRAAHDK